MKSFANGTIGTGTNINKRFQKLSSYNDKEISKEEYIKKYINKDEN